MILWVIKNELARGPRAGYSREDQPVPHEAVGAWVEDAKRLGIRSIICLLGDDQLPLYDALPGGLLAHYREQWFDVAHVSQRDHQSPPLSKAQCREAWEAYQALPKPVLVHCSGGINRTGWAVMYITDQLRRSRVEARDQC